MRIYVLQQRTYSQLIYLSFLLLPPLSISFFFFDFRLIGFEALMVQEINFKANLSVDEAYHSQRRSFYPPLYCRKTREQIIKSLYPSKHQISHPHLFLLSKSLFFPFPYSILSPIKSHAINHLVFFFFVFSSSWKTFQFIQFQICLIIIGTQIEGPMMIKSNSLPFLPF